MAYTRLTFHFTPISGSWFNLVESWFALLSQRRSRRGDLHSKDELEQAIEAFIAHNNEAPRPFIWKRPAHDILESFRRFCSSYLAADHPQHSSESDH